MTERRLKRCSFCGKERAVVSTPSAYICEFCLVEMQHEQREKLRQPYYDQICLEQARVLGGSAPAPKRTHLYPYPLHCELMPSLLEFSLDQARALRYPAKLWRAIGRRSY
jgi:hypothetical protein